MAGRPRTEPSTAVITDFDGYSPLFYNEICNIMRGLGDSQTSIRESVIIMEKILKQQLQGILNEAGAAAQRRAVTDYTPCVQSRDLIYIMRRNRVKVQRLIKFFKEYNARKVLEHATSTNVEGELITNNRLPAHFLDDIKHLVNIWGNNTRDEERLRRVERADHISTILDGKQYQEYAKSRRVSFCARNANDLRNKLRNWLLPRCEMQVSESAMLAIGFLVHETIARIVDMALLTRMDAAKKAGDPFERLSGGSYCTPSMLRNASNPDFPYEGAGVKAITVAEISEAMRRYNQPSRSFPTVSHPRLSKTTGPRLIALA